MSDTSVQDSVEVLVKEKLDQLVSYNNINFYYVKGHSGDEYNDRADYLARQGITDL